MNLADALVPQTFRNGEIIIEQGDDADGMYFVEEGTVRIMRAEHNQEEKQVNRGARTPTIGPTVCSNQELEVTDSQKGMRYGLIMLLKEATACFDDRWTYALNITNIIFTKFVLRRNPLKHAQLRSQTIAEKVKLIFCCKQFSTPIFSCCLR